MNRRPLRRRLAIRFAKLMRWLHIYLSMFGLAAVLFFSATGITLNHPDWFFGETQRSVQAEGEVDPQVAAPRRAASASADDAPDPSRQVAKLEVVEHLRQAHGIRGALADFRVDEAECVVTFKGPGYAADAFIDRESGHYTLTQSYHGFIAILNDLHKGRDTGPAWSVLIDVSAVLHDAHLADGPGAALLPQAPPHPGPGRRRRSGRSSSLRFIFGASHEDPRIVYGIASVSNRRFIAAPEPTREADGGGILNVGPVIQIRHHHYDVALHPAAIP